MKIFFESRFGPAPFAGLLALFAAATALFAQEEAPRQGPAAGGQRVLLQGCGCAVTLPAGYRINARNDRLVSALGNYRYRGVRIPVTLRFLCAPNPRRTSMISDIQDEAAAKGMNVRDFRTIEIAPELTAAYYLKSRIYQGRVIQNAEGYFATVADEYFLHIVPEAGAGPPPAGLGAELVQATGATLRTLEFFAPFESAITEANYRLRFYAAAGLVALGLLGGLFLVARSLLRNGRRRGLATTTNAAGGPEPPVADADPDEN